MFLTQRMAIGFDATQYNLFNELLVPCTSCKHIHIFTLIKEELRAPEAYDGK